VNAWLPESAVIALPLVRLILPKTLRVASVRGNPLRNVGKFGFAYRKVLRASDRVLLNAAHLAKIVVENFGISPERVEVIPNGVSIPEYVSDVSHQPPTAVVIANFHSYKGHLLLLEALAKVTTPIKVRLCGIGSTHTDIDEAISSLGLASVATIVDSPADIASELRAAQFAIHPSTTEGLSNAILEELASGLPVIAFDIDGNLPLISHGENGLLVKQSDVEQLARAIELMAADGELRIQLASGARASAEKYSWESSASRYAKTFSELIEKSGITN
jgi:glycosyltransferase involved in cell wall biosynthesis